MKNFRVSRKRRKFLQIEITPKTHYFRAGFEWIYGGSSNRVKWALPRSPLRSMLQVRCKYGKGLLWQFKFRLPQHSSGKTPLVRRHGSLPQNNNCFRIVSHPPRRLAFVFFFAGKKRTNKLILGKQSTNCVTRFLWVILTKLLKELTRISLKNCSFFVTSFEQFFLQPAMPKIGSFRFFSGRRRFKFANSFLANLDSSLVQSLRQRNFLEEFRCC